STDRQESSLQTQLEWALAEASGRNIPLEASKQDLEYMQARRLSSHKDIRLDDNVTGADMQRPGFTALNRDALSDRGVSHIFIYKRDRFARPDDAIAMVAVEKKLLTAGITTVFSDGVGEPLIRGQSDVARDFAMLFAYYESGEFLKKHAERVLLAQRQLA